MHYTMKEPTTYAEIRVNLEANKSSLFLKSIQYMYKCIYVSVLDLVSSHQSYWGTYKKGDKEQGSIQSYTTPEPGYHMGK